MLQPKSRNWPDKMSQFLYPQHLQQLKDALEGPLPGIQAQLRMVGRVRAMPARVTENCKQSAVLCLLFPDEGQLSVLLMKRKDDNTAHSGQVSFPGGKFEPADPDYCATAIREAREEVGINPEKIEILGALTPLYIPVSNFNVHPFVGCTLKLLTGI